MANKKTAKSEDQRFDLYEVITQKFITALEQGKQPWEKPYQGGGSGYPINGASGKPYRGVNTLLLWLEAVEKDYSTDIWLTHKQVYAAGGEIIEGQGKEWTMVTFWKPLYKDENGRIVKEADIKSGKVSLSDLTRIPCMRYYRVYNIDQCEGLESLREKYGAVEHTMEPDELDGLLEKMGVEVKHRGGVTPAYYPISDKIVMPAAVAFNSHDSYMRTKAHEGIHATGHSSRLNRGLEEYSISKEARAKEELIAEIGSSFFAAATGIKGDLQNHANYVGHWLEVLRNDKKFIVSASTKAKQACEFLLDGGAAAQPGEESDSTAALKQSA